jgi:hypothetical protein
VRFRTLKLPLPFRGFFGKWRRQLIVGAIAFLLAAPASLVLFRQADAICECNVFDTPTGQSFFNDGGTVELGFKVIPSVDGTITGVRFYKQNIMSGTHVGSLWEADGDKITDATFESETSSGWQSVTFADPVAVTANTTYVASVTMNDGRYIATPDYFENTTVNGPLTAPSSASSGGNGVFAAGGVFPNSSFNEANYWIDVSFFSGEAPTVQSVGPTDGATDVTPGKTITATFDQAMGPSSFTSSSFTVRDPQNNTVAGTYSYNAATMTASFVADAGFDTSTEYTATLEGGTGSTVNNLAEVPLAEDYTWSFTISPDNECPCSLKDRTAPEVGATFSEGVDVELGVKVVPSTNGYITSLRFYKPIISTDTTHTGRIWNAAGTSLATVNFTNETEYGWQEAKLSTPLQVKEGQVYVLSYTSMSGHYVSTPNALTGIDLADGYLTAHADESSENTATGSGTRNGVYRTGGGGYPNAGANGRYYWVDAVFSTSPATTFPLEVGVTQPTADAYGVLSDQAVSATFNRTVDSATITGATFRLLDKDGVQVAGTADYDTATGKATFTASQPLTEGEKYTAVLSGSIADPAGATLGQNYTWDFTVGTAITTDPEAAPGGPILIVTNAGDSFSTYYAEILRTEGLNYFDIKTLADVDTDTLADYKAVVLAETSLTQNQADMLSAWVTEGGNLVAMRPDSKLADLLGLDAAGSTRTNQYMLIDTSEAPGQGLVDESIQFKGAADNYALDGATPVATFYSDASTATSNPAVTTRQVGTKGGTAAAFTYDLAKSVVALHQGNRSWAGQERDGSTPRRPNDLFFGALAGDVQPDWVNLDKLHIPQADEQQRLLANILIDATKDKQPLPRFWYLPGDNKAALVMAGDDHALNNNAGTEITINDLLNKSRTDCSYMDWECVRASHYVYTDSALTNARAAQFHKYDFEIGDHVSQSCSNFASYSDLAAIYTADLTTWRAKYSSVPDQKTHRYHCYVWSDWDSQARAGAANGIRYDLNYVAFPRSWIGDRVPLITGSGMNMRFTDSNGEMLDVRQSVTNVDDQTAGVTATSVNAMLDGALNDDYYGIFGTHYDMSNNYDDVLYATAKARNVPMISSEQALAWLDGRDSSTFSNFSGTAGQYSFTVDAAMGASNLRAMLPIQDAGGTLDTLTAANSPVGYQTQNVKGVQYAVFDAVPGNYIATYTDYDPDQGGGPDDGGGEDGGSDNGGTDGGSSGGQDNGEAGNGSSGNGQGTGIDDGTSGNGGLPTTPTIPTDPATPSDPSENDKEKGDRTGKESSEIPFAMKVLIGMLLALVVFGGIWWFLSRRRKKSLF